MQVQVEGINGVHNLFLPHCKYNQRKVNSEVTCQGNFEGNPIFQKRYFIIFFVKVHI